MTSTQTETQVTTMVQQIDAQGPVVASRISSQFADIACSEENVRKLVDGLRNGTAVTLTSTVGGEAKTATITPPGKNLGYGETYIALAMAAEALRSAGVTGCATPQQWQAALLGGPLAAAGTRSTSTSTSASASSSSQFPGILTLRSQGQGWGRIAQTTNVKLGQVISSARTSLNLDASRASDLSPTGRSSAERNRDRTTTPSTTETSTSTTTPSTSTTTTPGTGTKSSTGTGTSDDYQPGKGKGKGKAKGQENDDTSSSRRSSESSSSPSSSSGNR